MKAWLIVLLPFLAIARPNVLFIAIDDLRPELGCYGSRTIQSPQIDALAASGVTFQRAYCQVAVCNPARVSLLTGLRPDSSRVWDLKTRFRETVPDVVTLPQHFKAQGYHTVSYGKIFHNPWPDNVSWSEPHAWPKAKLWSAAAKARHAKFVAELRATGQNRVAARIRPQATEIVDIPDEQHIDGAIARQAITAMRRLAKADKPFFLAAGFIRPHLPFVVPREYWELYDAERLPIIDSPRPQGAPTFASNTMYELRDYLDFHQTPTPLEAPLSLEQRRRLTHGYYASVSFIDAQVGQLLAELKALGLADNTIVVLWGDHGWKLGEHNSWCKQTNYEIDARVPLIVRAPGAAQNGQQTDALVELLDIYPTLCELSGLPTPAHVEGKSLSPFLSTPNAPAPAAAFSQFQRQDGERPLMGYALRTPQYRYVEWQDRRTREVQARELYDHGSDPGESRNIAASEPQRVAQLSKQLWAGLPQPPLFRSEPVRPRAVFRNDSSRPVTLFWIHPDGTPREEGVIAPGKQLVRNSTLGHRFRVGKREFVVTAAEQTFHISASRPNIVICMADDWSAPHASILGDPTVRTPHFDRVARAGRLYHNAFVSTPSCTPSRLSFLTGQHHWRLREGANLGGSLREEYPVYTELLQAAGYFIGRSGKGVWPSKHEFRKRDSFGTQYRNFDEFLKARPAGQPYCFFFGGKDPHRPYITGIGAKNGIHPPAPPPILPDHPDVRADIADYYWHVQRFDSQVGEVLAALDATGEAAKTLFVVTSDNGMPFPRGKATLYELGTHVPLAIRWPAKFASLETQDLTSLCDLAPTFLEAAGLPIPADMTGRSLLSTLPAREFILTGNERHSYWQPSRALRTQDFLYIQNFDPKNWVSGPAAYSHNIDPSPSKQLLSDPAFARFAEFAMGRRAPVEIYHIRNDPHQLNNLAGNPEFAPEMARLARLLQAELEATGDPRVVKP
ncbi:MAG: iduronate 2-sulfatase [Rhodothermales bacterium]|jgi:iduronate 2-sulfatase